MWGSIVNAAKSIYHAIVPSSKPVQVKPSSSGNAGGLQVRPIAPTPSVLVKPIAPTPSVSVRPIAPTPSVAVRPIAPTPGVVVAQSAAAQAARAATIAQANQKQQGLLATVWRNTLGKAQSAFSNFNTSRIIHQTAAKNEAQFQVNAKTSLDTHLKARARQYQQLQQAVDQRKLSYKDAVAQAAAWEKADSKLGDSWNQSFAQLEQQRVQNPGAISNAVDRFRKLTGGVLQKPLDWLNYAANVPKRVLNTGYNLAAPGRPVVKDGAKIEPSPTWSTFVKTHGGKADAATLKQFNQAMNAWSNRVNKSNMHYSGNPITRVRQAWNASNNQSVLDPNNVGFRGSKQRAIGNFALDPIWFLPGGNTARIAKAFKGSKAGEVAASAFSKLAQTKPGQVFSKLGAETRTTNQKWLDQISEKFGIKSPTLEGKDLQAYQDLMQGKKVNWDGIDRVAVQKFAGQKRNFYDALHQTEQNAGLDPKYNRGYMPTKQKPTDKLFSFLQKAGKGKGSSYLDAEGLRRAEAFRVWEHLNAVKAAGVKLSGNLPKEYRDMVKVASSDPKVLRQAPNRRFLSTDTSSLRGLAKAPEHVWKQAVLKYNPAWYVHNLGWNIPASFMAGGVHTVGGYAKMLRRGSIKNLPKSVTDGSFGGIGGAVENFSRGAAYHAGISKGMTEDASVKNVNKYLFDYGSHKNWETPFRQVLPFWGWQKNITRLMAQLPLDNPRSAKLISGIMAETQAQLAKLPADQRDQYKGSLYIPGKGWTTSAFTPFLPDQFTNAGFNPLITTAQRASSGKDYFGNDVAGESNAQTLLSNLPQWRWLQPLMKTLGNASRTKTWVAGSGYTKEQQGYDPSQPNYSSKMDFASQTTKAGKSFLGIPSFRNFDAKRYAADKTYKAFSDEYFKTDWKAKYPNANDRNVARDKLAKKYGYDLQKDIYNGKWAKNDSASTTKVKEAASNFWADDKAHSDFWKSYYATTDKNARKAMLDAHPEYKSTSFTTTSKSYSKTNSQYAHKVVNPKTGKVFTSYKTPQQEKNAKIAWAYANLNPDVRHAYLQKEGLLDPARANWTNAQWQSYLTANGKDAASKIGADLTKFSSLGQSQLDNVNKIVASFQPTVKNSRGIKWARSNPKAVSYRQKALTFKRG